MIDNKPIEALINHAKNCVQTRVDEATQKIKNSLQRSAAIDADKIHVEVIGGKCHP